MRSSRSVCVAALLVTAGLACLPASTQGEDSKRPVEDPPGPTHTVAPPEPSATMRDPALERLLPLLGGWQGTFSAPPTEMDPAESSTLGVSARWILGGHYLEMRLRHRFMESDYEVLALWSAPLGTGEYRLYWMDSSSSVAQEFRGPATEGAPIVLTMADDDPRAATMGRLRLVPGSVDGWTLVSESGSGERWIESARYTATERR